ncbi:MAG: 2-amino-4-hydroxy-6-hydroxymethyldihydropteridine diphosphokinase [Actinobacteria bacterium]|jgi:2-amino-4-hydroxy-6-hydroxymethyldihydropteridine diphosphokinase|nr:2-amino-4-hydroxy-6-hydroxymethyldihydropteridine diphosphokinase [Actinomycetota bacterium]
MKIVLALGSNLGDRESNLDQAISELEKIIEITHLSTLHETAPVGGPKQGDYLNAVLIGETQLDPHELLALTSKIETKLGRVREVRNGPRTVDIDLIVFGELQIKTPDLELPHPRAHEREFVLAPWLEIDPDAQIPGRSSVAKILAELAVSE